jgi:hypothetical protein
VGVSTMEARTLSVGIERPLAEVYEFLAEPRNFACWAKGLDLNQDIRFSARNPWGVADHSVFLAGGREIYVPLRAIRNGTGTEVLLTFFRQPDMTHDVAERDTQLMQGDLYALKAVLEA